MRRILGICLAMLIAVAAQAQSWVRVNTVGYLPNDIKVAVFISTEQVVVDEFNICDASTDEIVFTGKAKAADGSKWAMKSAGRLNFSAFKKEGGYYILCNGVKSPNFKISASAYDGLSDFMLVYMRQQRCGDNPYTNHLCHQHDGYIVDHPTKSGQKIDVRGGWHDATDYLQYQTTSATAAYHMMFAYYEQEDKSVFKDRYGADGRPGANGVPDIIDEIKWGLDWLNKMNPADKEMYNQIADDRDHAGFRYPYKDTVDYGWGPGKGRPVYFVTGKPQGLGKYINRTTGVASTAGKFASTFAMGAHLFRERDPKYAKMMQIKAEQAFKYGEENPGNTQTACLVSPYFYEEDTYTDDLELAAATMMELSGDKNWAKKADYWGQLEPVTPWMELGRGRHYQWYPFINLGHYYLAKSSNKAIAEKYQGFMRDGLECILNRGKDDPFMHGVPYLWCSNNLTSAAITQARLYNKVTGDNTYLELEMALRDWLLGCNPWGTSMIVGIPFTADSPVEPHSSYTVECGDLTHGGLIDGPIYYDLFHERAGGALTHEDYYAVFNNGRAVYHDDIGDYSSNEPTMDGTAGLTYYFATMQNMGNKQKSIVVERDIYGAINKIEPTKKNIYLVFTADSMFQGGKKVVNTLKKHNIKGSFFFTGNALRMEEHKDIITEIVAAGHYVGGHSDKHLLYATWENRDSLIVSLKEIEDDIKANAKELEKFGITKEKSLWFIPPYEYYNSTTVELTEKLGYKVLNYTPGTATPADYTTPTMVNYQPTQKIINKLYNHEKAVGLNGAIILIHPGVSDSRDDKLYNRLDEIITHLTKCGYSFKGLNEIE